MTGRAASRPRVVIVGEGPSGIEKAAARPAKISSAPPWLRVSLYLLLLATFIVVALRQLNFDESLTVRAGWLLLKDLPGEPNFYMPVTWLVGSLAGWIDDPGYLFPILRLLCLVSVLASLGWAVDQTGLGQIGKVVAMILMLLNWTFLVHAFEFRYDWAILVGLGLAYGLLSRSGLAKPVLLGVVIAWLLAHHLKGLYFAGFVYLMALARVGKMGNRFALGAAQLHLGILATAGVWVAISALGGHLDELIGVYRQFFDVAASSSKVWPWESLSRSLMRDAAWWLGAVASAACAAFRLVAGRARRPDLESALLFALAIVLFWFLHPHPWAYMLALPVPFLAVLVVDAIEKPKTSVLKAAVAIGLVLMAGLQWWLGFPLGGAYLASLDAPMTEQVSTLRALKQHARPGDRVIDPSGLVYFLPPIHPQWYLDSLFAERADQGQWMEGMVISMDPGQWALLTYRLASLTEPYHSQVRRSFVPVGGGLALSRKDPRLQGGGLRLPLQHRTLDSFW